MSRTFEEVLSQLKFKVLTGKKENPPNTLTMHTEELQVIGSKAMESAFSSCELTPEYGVSCFNARDRGDFGKMIVEHLFANKLSCIPSYSGLLRGFCHVTYEDGSDFQFKI